MKLGTLLSAAGIYVGDRQGETEVSGVVTDSRKAKKDSMFVCIRGIHVDGHEYIEDALERGATVIVTEDGEERQDPRAIFINTHDTRSAVAHFYDAYYGFPSRKMKFVGVTGTNGKTSVTFLLKAIFEAAFYRCGLVGTVHSLVGDTKIDIRPTNATAHMTTPDPEELYQILSVMAAEGVEYVFMEITSHALKLRKPDAIHFDMAAFTNLTPEHLDFHKDMEDYFRSKARLFSMADRCVINSDGEYGKRMAREAECEVKTFSAASGKADYFVSEKRNHGVEGVSYCLNFGENSFMIKSPMVGEFSIANTLAAAAIALEMGISPCVIQKALYDMRSVSGRMERVEIGREHDFSIFIDYAHTPDALEKLLLSARAFRREGQRIVVLFGCGGDRDKSKRSVMGEIASRLSDFAIITSDNSRSEDPEKIIRDILEGLDRTLSFAVIPDRREAIEFAVRNARQGDIILLAGKGHESYEIDNDGVHPFSEKEIVLEAIEKYKRK